VPNDLQAGLVSKRAHASIVEQSENVMKLRSRDDAVRRSADLNHAFARGDHDPAAKQRACHPS
jgi:hypothetical protein